MSRRFGKIQPDIPNESHLYHADAFTTDNRGTRKKRGWEAGVAPLGA